MTIIAIKPNRLLEWYQIKSKDKNAGYRLGDATVGWSLTSTMLTTWLYSVLGEHDDDVSLELPHGLFNDFFEGRTDVISVRVRGNTSKVEQFAAKLKGTFG